MRKTLFGKPLRSALTSPALRRIARASGMPGGRTFAIFVRLSSTIPSIKRFSVRSAEMFADVAGPTGIKTIQNLVRGLSASSNLQVQIAAHKIATRHLEFDCARSAESHAPLSNSDTVVNDLRVQRHITAGDDSTAIAEAVA